MHDDFLVILVCSILSIHCRITFKIKKTCENKRDVTIVTHIQFTEKYIKAIVTDLTNECINFTLVKLQPYEEVNVNSLKPIDISFNHWLAVLLPNKPRDDYLIEYLQSFAQKPARRRTLVVFYEKAEYDIAVILYKLQREKNVEVIFIYERERHKKSVLRGFKHSGLLASTDTILNLKSFADVIKNANHCQLKYDKNPTSSFLEEKRSCLSLFEYFHLFLVEISRNNISLRPRPRPRPIPNKVEILTIERDKNDVIRNHYKFKDGNTSHTQLDEYFEGILKATKVIHLRFNFPSSASFETASLKMRRVEKILKNNLQRDFIIYSTARYGNKRIYGNSHEYDVTRMNKAYDKVVNDKYFVKAVGCK